MRQRVQRGAAAVAIAVAIGAGASAPAPGAPADDRRAELDVAFGTTKPATPTGLRLRVRYKNPSDPAAKPPPITAALFALPPGTRIDGTAVTACEASDSDLRAQGRNACPASSNVGSGTLTAATGFGPPADPVRANVTVFNGGDELIELVSAVGTDATLGFDRLGIEGSSLRAHPPSTPGGPPDGKTSISEVSIALPARGRLITTPRTCAPGGRWTSVGSFAFADGGRATVASGTPCVAPARRKRPRVRLRVRPRRAVAGERIRFRVRAGSSARRCTRRAAVRFGARRVRTDRSGRAVFRATPRRIGRRKVTLRKPGCRPARAWVRVRRPARPPSTG